MEFADAQGNALPIARLYSLSYTSTAGNGKFLDWNYRPLDELHNLNNTTRSIDNRINLGLSYGFLKNFSVSAKYQYENASTVALNNYDMDTYYTRNLINKYTQVNATTGALTYPIPLGSILLQTNTGLVSHRGRLQANYNQSWKSLHEVTAIAGAEISSAVSDRNNLTTYGYPNYGTSISNIDYVTNYSTNPSSSAIIPSSNGYGESTDHYISYFSNAAYTYDRKYTLSLSGRIDKSNLFGVSTNQKAVPLYSAGLAWDLSKEKFYQLSWLPYVKLRATYGYTGNINKSATAVTTLRQYSSGNVYTTTLPFAQIANPGNPELRWEKTRMINLGLDFAAKNNILSGSLEYFYKKGTDIFGNSTLAPSTGLTTFFGNTADIKGNGFDLVINSQNIYKKNFKWTSNLLLSHSIDIVTKYNVNPVVNTLVTTTTASNIVPLTGKALYGIYAYKYAGLTHNTGDPQGYLNGQVSTDYANILSKTTYDDLVYYGSARPTIFGSFRNTFSYKQLSLSCNIVYKFNYYFRRNSWVSSGMPYNGNIDYYNRWQQPGDELTTNVPALVYPPYNTNRDNFYKYSSVLVDKGDHIRLQDVTLGYEIDQIQWKRLPFRHVQLYGYVNNVGILWRANKDHLDPDLVSSTSLDYPLPRTISLGLKTTF